MTDDAELLRRYAAERSEPAFAEFVQQHLGLVYTAALRRTNGDEHRAREVAQQVFTTVARRAASLAQHDALTGWLYTATRNAALNLQRDEQRRRIREHEAQAMNELLTASAPEAEWNRVRPVLDEAMDELSGVDREAVLLRFFEGRGFAEVGTKLRLSENAARMRVERALDKLRVQLSRRGITSTSAALGAVLANQAGAAAPVGLAASVTGAALVGTTVGVGGALGFLTVMNTSKILAAVLGIGALLAVAMAVYQHNVARDAGAAFVLANQSRAALTTRLVNAEARALRAEKRAEEAEKDNGELLKAVESVRRQNTTQTVASQAASPREQMVVGAVFAGAGGQMSDEEKERLAQERAYQQDLARRRAADARRRAEFDAALAQLDPAERFNRRVEAAEQFAAKAEFQEGIRALNQAMAQKPADLPLSENVRQLQATLQAQNSPVEVPFVSDGITSVSVVGQKFLGKIETATAKILPGDYEVIGRRPGFQDAVIALSVRAGITPVAVSVTCTQPIKP